jgi:hypothetical protein
MASSTFHYAALYRLREGVTLDRVRAARKALAELVETLPGVLHLAVVDNLSADNRGFTLCLFAVFENRHAFEVCSRHPEWLEVRDDMLAPVVAERLLVEGEG